MSQTKLDLLDELVKGCVKAGVYSACVFAVAKEGKLVRERAFGALDRSSAARPTQLDSVFDVMSITKTVATASSTMRLVEKGKLSLDTKVGSIFEEFSTEERKSRIRVRDLVTMSSGLSPEEPGDNGLMTASEATFDKRSGPDALRSRVLSHPAVAEPGTKLVYSDVDYRTLGFALEEVAGLRLDELARREVFEPCGLVDICYTPGAAVRNRCPETGYSKWRGRKIIGETIDDFDYALGGVLGHAGAFSTARDLSAFMQIMLNEGRIGSDARLFEPETVRMMTSDQVKGIPPVRRPATIVQATGGMMRGLGFELKLDVENTYMGTLFSPRSFGKWGGTGCFMAADPETMLSAVLLTNTPMVLSADEPGWESGDWFRSLLVSDFFDLANLATAS
ncbi:MAG: beta-lactamase family protein [Thaumarchaeota archaeon]|nr:beta-lactamase family protein [Nitrososphaerota archaeon]